MFQGFDEKTVEFMWGLRFHNEKSWFGANRQVFQEHFQSPMQELCGELYAHVSGKLTGYPLRAKVSRIYRDARRNHSGGPYRDHLWISMEQPCPSESEAAVPCLWFELTPDSWGYGMGYYMAKPLTMAKLRARIERDPKPLSRLMAQLHRQQEFLLEGEEYKKPKPGSPPDGLEIWYRKKNFSLTHVEPLSELIYSRTLLDRLLPGYDFLIPWYRFCVSLDGDPEPAVPVQRKQN